MAPMRLFNVQFELALEQTFDRLNALKRGKKWRSKRPSRELAACHRLVNFTWRTRAPARGAAASDSPQDLQFPSGFSLVSFG